MPLAQVVALLPREALDRIDTIRARTLGAASPAFPAGRPAPLSAVVREAVLLGLDVLEARHVAQDERPADAGA
jgi:hypothetical protein